MRRRRHSTIGSLQKVRLFYIFSILLGVTVVDGLEMPAFTLGSTRSEVSSSTSGMSINEYQVIWRSIYLIINRWYHNELGDYFNFWAMKIRISKPVRKIKNIDSIVLALVARFINALHRRSNMIGRERHPVRINLKNPLKIILKNPQFEKSSWIFNHPNWKASYIIEFISWLFKIMSQG